MSLTEGESVTLTATVLPEDAADKTVAWSSSSDKIVVIASNGKAKAIAAGEAIITAKSGDKSDFITITVVANAIPVTGISLNPSEITMKVGESQVITAEVTPQDATDKSVTWESSNPEVASVDNGTVVGIKPGSVTITATTVNGRKTAECEVTIKANLAPSVTVGADHISAVSAILSGEANLESSTSSDLTMGIMWSLNSGVLPANSTKIEAKEIKAKEGFDASYEYNVGITGLDPVTTYYYRSYVTQNGQDTYGETLSFTTKELSSLLVTQDATEIQATSAKINAMLDLTNVLHESKEYGFYWGVSESDLPTKLSGSDITENTFSAAITNLSHKTQYWYKAYAVIDSQTFYGDIKAFTTDVVSVESVSLDKTNYTFNTIGNALTLTATVLPDDATDKAIEWTSSNEDVATVTSGGEVKAVGNGTATITVTTVDQGKTASCAITVAQLVTEISLNKTAISLNEGQTESLVATISPTNANDKTLTWTSSDESVATVDQTGNVIAVSKGTATIRATANDGGGKNASCAVTVIRPVSSIELNKTSITVYNGKTETITAAVIPSTASYTDVNWTSSNTSIATVSSSGVVTGVARGTASITATAKDGSGVSASCEVEVKQYVTKISLSKTSLSINEGQTETLTATISPTNANDKSVTWTSSNESVATVDQTGKVTAVSKGTVTIKATANDGGGKSASCNVKVKVIPTGAVDLGLSVYWATCNLGASKPEEYGNYYAWGETETKSDYSWSNYKFGSSHSGPLSKYNTMGSHGSTVDNKTVLEPQDDAARFKLGGTWRIPTDEEWTELWTSCTWIWTTENGVNGYKVTGPNGNSIFLPAAGLLEDTSLINVSSRGHYWSSCLKTNDPGYSLSVLFHSLMVFRDYCDRSRGLSVRPVTE